MKIIMLTICTMLSLFGLHSCKKKPKNVVPPLAQIKDIYISGTETINGTHQACYWKNGNKVILASSTEECVANDIEVTKNGDVYVCGTIGTKPQVVYWKNGIQYNVTNTNDKCTCSSIELKGDSVYIGGSIYVTGTTFDYVPMIWSRKGTMGKDVQMTNNAGAITALTLYNGKMYATANLIFDNWSRAAYFLDNKLNYLVAATVKESYAEDIVIEGDSIYIVGAEADLNYVVNAVFWKNGKQYPIQANATAKRIDVLDGYVYTCGYFQYILNNRAIYWNNTARNLICDPSKNSEAVDIKNAAGENFVLATEKVANSTSKILLFRNNSPTTIGNNAKPTSLFVTTQ
jgi:hypothetical protein